jgi:alkylhydroperoxidase family enzyme
MSHWPKHTDGHRRWRALEDHIEAEREADWRRQAEEDQREAEREAERRAAFAAGVGELQASWRERERVRAEPETGRGAVVAEAETVPAGDGHPVKPMPPVQHTPDCVP